VIAGGWPVCIGLAWRVAKPPPGSVLVLSQRVAKPPLRLYSGHLSEPAGWEKIHGFNRDSSPFEFKSYLKSRLNISRKQVQESS